jgi:hypothetical protein
LWLLVAAEYSTSLDRLVIVATQPNQLIVLDPESGEPRVLALSAAPAALSLHPDGRSVAIAHDHAISIVQLDPLQMLDSIPNSLDRVMQLSAAAVVRPAPQRCPQAAGTVEAARGRDCRKRKLRLSRERGGGLRRQR